MADPDLALEFEVNPAELDGCGQSAQHVAGLVPDETSKITDPCDQAAAGLQGWLTASAVRDCGANWKALLDRLGGDMGDVGGKLASSAGYYRQVEQDIQASMGSPSAPVPHEPDPFGTTVPEPAQFTGAEPTGAKAAG
ncbi:hypothetical protein [Kitasatospora sp. SUK 42]|uniref:hypothetical protein n=1 Tax=Kitasatospora sp. SUK 42 TaxID=1588882 RepID=UPI0018C92D9C|nr:hypothetical protein [Kitasatospora sp. SUK 42]MBV2156750.1 hypothetical protein [Kitasatospora sp. SUK 42]